MNIQTDLMQSLNWLNSWGSNPLIVTNYGSRKDDFYMPSHDYLPHSQSHLDEMRREEQEYEEYYEATNHLRWYGKAPSFTEWKRNEIGQKQLKEEVHKYCVEYEEDDELTKQLVKKYMVS